MLRTKYKGYKRYKHERKVSGCLQNFDHVTTVHESLGGLEHMERPPRSFERKLDPATLGIQMAHWGVVKSPKTSEKIVIFRHSKVWEELLMTFLVQLWAKQQNEPYTIHLFESWIQDTLIKLLRW